MTVIITYLVVGAVALFLFDLFTHKIRDKFVNISYQNQIYSGDIGVPTPTKVARFMTALFLLLEWPLPILVHFVVSRKDKEKNNVT